jgi:hypothetical protein
MAIRVSDRDLAVIAKCAVSKALTTSQLVRTYFPEVTPDAARKSLRRLCRTGYLISFRANPMAEALYGVGPQGRALLAAKGLEVEISRKPPVEMAHIAGINDIRLSLESEPNRVAFFFACWELAGMGWDRPVIPDAAFALKLPERHAFLLEYDRGTETLERLSRKFHAYAEGLAGFPFEAVVLVAETSTRLENARRSCSGLVSLRLFGAPLATIGAAGVHAAHFQCLCPCNGKSGRLCDVVSAPDLS